MEKEIKNHKAYLLLGSNYDSENNLLSAFQHLCRLCKVLACSSVYESKPIPSDKNNKSNFLNAIVSIETEKSPSCLKKEVCLKIEHKLGRQRNLKKENLITIDIDIILYGDFENDLKNIILDSCILTHAHISVPLAEVAPDQNHPITGQSFKAIAKNCTNEERIWKRKDIKLTI